MAELDDILGMAAAEAPKLPDDAAMKGLTQKCEDLIDYRRRIVLAEEVLNDLRKEEQRLSSQEIPTTMIELGLKSVTLQNGQQVSYRPFYSGKIIPENQEEAFEWLEKNGNGGAIKGALTIQFRRNDRDEAVNLMRELQDEGWAAGISLSVHHSTLKALFREVIENGGSFPTNLFDLYIGNQTILK